MQTIYPRYTLNKKRLKTGFTSFTEVQLIDYQSLHVNLHAFTEVSHVSHSIQRFSGKKKPSQNGEACETW